MNIAAGKGKIARLDPKDRDEVCMRLLANEPGSKIIPWIHSQPRCVEKLKENFGEDWEVSDQNLSTWRQSGFQKWIARRDRLESTKELARFAAEITKAGGSLSDGAAAIAAGKLLEILEGLGDEKPTPETLDALTLALSRLRAGDHTAEKLRLTTLRLDQTADLLALEQQKFQRTTCELFLKWREDDRARRIADGPGTNEDKIEHLGQEMFGDLWKAK